MGWPVLYYFTRERELLRGYFHTFLVLIFSGGTLICKNLSNNFFHIGLVYITQHYFFESIYHIFKFESLSKTLTLHHVVSGLLAVNLLKSDLSIQLIRKMSCLIFLFELPNLTGNLVRMSKFPEIYNHYLPLHMNRTQYQIWSSWIFIFCRGIVGIPLISYWFLYQPDNSLNLETDFYSSMIIRGCWIFQILLNLKWSWSLFQILHYQWESSNF